MRSFWIRTGLKYDDGCLRRHRKGEDTEEGLVRTQAEIGITHPQNKEHQGGRQPPEVTSGMEGIVPQSF